MRKFVVVLVLILIIAAILPGAAGYQFKQQYLSLLAASDAANPNTITVTEYHEYWLSSDAIITVKLDEDQKPGTPPPGPNVPHTLTFVQHITHGPYIKNDQTGERQFALAFISSQAHLEKNFEDKVNAANSGVMQIRTFVSFFNKYNSQVSTPIFSIKLPNQTRISWQGMNGTVEADVSHNQVKVIKSSFSAGPLSIQAATASFTVNSMQTNGEKDCDENTLCSGTADFSVPLMVSTTPEHSIKMSNVSFGAKYGVDAQNHYNSNITFALNRFETPDYFIGPLQFNLNVSNINASELKKVLEISKQASSNVAGGEDMHNNVLLVAELYDVMPHTITASTAITQSANVKTSYGNLEENARVYWPPKTPLPTNSTDLTKLTMTLNARAATSLVDQVISMIDEKNASQMPLTPAAAPAVPGVSSATGDVTKPQNFEASVYLLIGQGLSQDEEKALLILQQKNVSKEVFNSYVDSRVAIKAIPASLAGVLKQDYVNASLANPAQNAAAAAGANKQLDDWVNQNKITSDTRTKLIALQKQHLSSEIYAASINDVVRARRLPQDLAATLKAEYAANAPSDTGLGGEDTSYSAAPTPAPVPAVVTSSGETRLQFDAWIRSGYVKQEKDDYVVNVVFENGVLKVSGITVPLQAQDQVPSLPAQ